MKKISLFLLFTFLSFQIFSQISKQNHSINVALQRLKNDKDLKNASFGCFVKDLTSGEIIAEYNADLSLIPASNMKVITTAAALEVLGENFRFATTIEYDGEIDTAKRTLNGNIYIKGGADPTLGSKHFAETRSRNFLLQWTEAIKKLNIDTINGKIIADAEIIDKDVVSPRWCWQDIANWYGTPAFGISIYDNQYSIFFESGKKKGDSTKIIEIRPQIPNLVIENRVFSEDANTDDAYIFGAPYSYFRLINGTIPKNKSKFEVIGSLPDPPNFAATEFRNFLRENKIFVRDSASSIRELKLKNQYSIKKRKKISQTFSPSVKEICFQTNMHSNNLFCEHLMMQIALQKDSVATIEKGCRSIYDFWKSKGMEMQGINLEDGSGLSKYNLLTTKHLVFVLEFMRDKESFYKSLPVAGESGTLSWMCKGGAAQGKVRAKSGSIFKVRAYSGYAETASKRKLGFSILVNNFTCSEKEMWQKLVPFLNALAELNI